MSGKKKEQKLKHGLMKFEAGQPVQLEEDDGVPAMTPTPDQQLWIDVLGNCLKAYVNAARELLNGKYAGIRPQAPAHLAEASFVMAVRCADGIIIRYDVVRGKGQKTDKPSIYVGFSSETLSELAPKISESVVHCYGTAEYESEIPTKGPEITLFKTDAAGGKQLVIARIRVGVDAVIQPQSGIPSQVGSKPQPLVTVGSSLELHVLGEMVSVQESAGPGKPFLIRNRIRLPVGWEFIEVYASPDMEQWKPEYAGMWAENDLLASVVAAQFREQHYRSLDPRAGARKEFEKILTEYKQLLDSEPEREEILQLFLNEHPVLLCPAHTVARPKVALGPHVTDFIFREATGGYLLVELERSTQPLFVQKGDTSAILNHARNQIVDWRRYIEDNLDTVQREVDLPGISANPAGLVVIGRSSSLSTQNRRKLVSMENESPKTRIMTYDDVYENAKAIASNLLGPLWFTTGTTEVYYLPEDGSADGQ